MNFPLFKYLSVKYLSNSILSWLLDLSNLVQGFGSDFASFGGYLNVYDIYCYTFYFIFSSVTITTSFILLLFI